MSPLELALEIRPRARLGLPEGGRRRPRDALVGYGRYLYSPHDGGLSPASLADRLTARRQGLEPYWTCSGRCLEGAGYKHDSLELRHDLGRRSAGSAHEWRLASRLHGRGAAFVRRLQRTAPESVYLIDFDGVTNGEPRRRVTSLVGYNNEVVVARTSLDVPVSAPD